VLWGATGLFYYCARHLGTYAHFALLFTDAIGLVDHGAGIELLCRRSLADAFNYLGARLVGFAGV